MAEGTAPTLAELVALRGSVGRRAVPAQGRFGVAGPAQSPMRGRGMEYAESREYSPGDDARHIDWRLTARTGRAHTKLFQAERERLSLIVADTAPALYFGTRVRFKSVQAARAGAVAAWASARDGDRIAAVCATAGEQPVPPGSGVRGALRVIDALVRWYAGPPTLDEGALIAAIEHARRLLRPGSRVVVLADAARAASVPEPLWLALARGHEIAVLVLTDPLELEPPPVPVPFAWGLQRAEVDLGDASTRQRWQREFAEPLAALQQRLPQLGVRMQMLSTAAPSESWLGLLGRAQPQVA